MSNDTFFEPIPFDDSEAIEFDDSPAPEADYELQVSEAKAGTSKAGNPKIDWAFRIVEDFDGHDGKYVWHTTPTTGRGAGMFKAVIKALGYDFAEWLDEAGGMITPESLLSLYGERVSARIKIDVPTEEVIAAYPNAKERNKIHRFL